MNYAGSYKEFEIVIVTLIFSDVVPQLNSHSLFPALSRGNLSVALLHFVIHCSVFKVHPLTTLAIRFEDPTFQSGLQIQQQTLSGGPEWARTTDLAIISRTL